PHCTLASPGANPLPPRHEFELFLGPDDLAWSEEYAIHHQLKPGPCLGIHVGSGGTKNLKLKRWPFPQWLELIQRLVKRRPEVTLLLFGGPQEKTEHEEILQATKGQRVLAPTTANFRQSAALLKYCHAFLSVDTVLMHLAAAMKVPNQLVIEAPTLNPTNLPWQTQYRVIPNPAVAGRNLDYYRYDGGPIRGTDAE